MSQLLVVVESDSNSAKSLATRLGLGKQRHVQTRYLWLQERVAAHDLIISKIASGKNVADILTKLMQPPEIIQRFLQDQLFALLPTAAEEAEEVRRAELRQGQRKRRKERRDHIIPTVAMFLECFQSAAACGVKPSLRGSSY